MTNSNTTMQRLYLIMLSSTQVTFPTGQTITMSMGCYLIQTSDGKNILVDSGFPGDYKPSGQGPVLPRPEKNIVERLAELGLQPDDIHMLICTHFDIDHAGYHDSFPKAEHVVQRQHYELARGGHPRFAPARPRWDHPSLHYRLVDGDTELLPGLTVLETSGHTPGHQSVLLSLPQTGPVLLAIDAVPLARAFTIDRQLAPVDDNLEQLRASTRKLLDLVESEHISLVVFHHDGDQWQSLKTAPASYE